MHGVRARLRGQDQGKAVPGETPSPSNQRRSHLPRVHTGGWRSVPECSRHRLVCLGAKRARREKPPFPGLLLLLKDIFNEVRVFVLF